MGDHVLLVTGSRHWPDWDKVLIALAGVAHRRPDDRLVLFHGQCDPRRPGPQPGTFQTVSWYQATHLDLAAQSKLLGGDWLADWAARQLGGWVIERYPADWDRCGRRAGMIRNLAMVQEITRRMTAGATAECVALVASCIDPRCAGQEPHSSHGAMDCATKAKKAGIPGRMIRTGDNDG